MVLHIYCNNINAFQSLTDTQYLTQSSLAQATASVGEFECRTTITRCKEALLSESLNNHQIENNLGVSNGIFFNKSGPWLDKSGKETKYRKALCNKCDLTIRSMRENETQHINKCALIDMQVKLEYRASNAKYYFAAKSTSLVSSAIVLSRTTC